MARTEAPPPPPLAPFQLVPIEENAERALARDADRRRFLHRAVAVAVAASIVLVTLGLLAMQATNQQRFSPIDESAHLDYVLRALEGEFVHAGDRSDPTLLRELLCRGIDSPNWTWVTCSPDPQEFAAFAEGNANYLYVHPPVYYFLTAWTAKPLIDAGMVVLQAARLIDGVWLALGLLVLWHLLRREEVPPLARGVALLVVAAHPLMLFFGSTVTNDATALLAGGLVLAAVFAWQRGRDPSVLRWLMLPAAASFAVSLKLTNFIVVMVAGIFLLLRAWWREPPERERTPAAGRYLLASVLTVAGGVMVLVLWSALSPEKPDGFVDPMWTLYGVPMLSAADLFGRLPDLVPPTRGAIAHSFLDYGAIVLIGLVFNWLLGIASVVALVKGSPKLRALVVATLAGLVLGAIFITLGNYLQQGVFIGRLPARYGFSAMPALGLLLACASTFRPMLVGFAGVGLASVLVVGYGLVGLLL